MATVRSFDIFDTLIARKTLSPQSVFATIEARTRVPGFAEARGQVAFAFGTASHSIDDIYQELARRCGYSTELANTLKAAEIAVEFEQVIPITENLLKVRDGDLLITDMYLPDSIIFGLLQKAGLRRNVHLIRTALGKATGEVWKGLNSAGIVATHLGDNPHSDVKMAHSTGHIPTLTGLSGLTEIESFLFRQGFTGCALLARILRLTGAKDDSTAEQLRLLQAQINIPLLAIASLWLGHLLSNQLSEINRIAFSSRDCTGWLKLFRAIQVGMGRKPIETDYFYTSRVARRYGGEAYADYARAFLRPGTLLVDLCGSGLSMQSFLEKLALPVPCLYLFKVTQQQMLQRVQPLYPGTSTDKILSFIDSGHLGDMPPLPGEWLNLVDHGMTLSMQRAFGAFLPVLDDIEFTPQQISWIRLMGSEIDRSVDYIGDPLILEHLSLRDAFVPPERIRETLAALWLTAGRSQTLAGAFSEIYMREENKIHQTLATARASDPK